MPLLNESQKAEDCTLEPIAICGMACRLPGGVDSASSLWQLLLRKGSVQTPKVPASRFNIDSYYHANLDRPGSFNVLGGYFLDGPLDNFDHSFFNMTPIEAMWLDPQQRKMLEVCYEALESAGLTLDDVAGSNTAVFVGSFTSDYQQMSTKEPDFRHSYAATGVDPGIISNRIGNIFNLKGPSFTINTACSSSIYAIHNACHALRARDCEAAIVGGVNLIITVDQHMNTAKLGILSPTSTCHTFDASADGYGRAEGAGALYLKRLSDAIRDGDPVRSVIRSSAVNTNGKVPGMGITHPSVEGQERVVRMAYERANLNPTRTAYLECHGTGTPVGDPIEVRAVSNAMNDTRPNDKPLLIGAIKANIGHSEAASGIFAVMKAAMMTEKGIIPGVCGLKNLNPAIHEREWNVKVHADTAPWPKDSISRRASVSSFGYGGTNGHIIVEDVNALYPWYQHGKPKHEAPYDNSAARPFLIGFSAHDKTNLTKNIAAHANVANQFYLSDLAYTINTKRTRFAQRAFVIAREGHEVEDFAPTSLKFGSVSKTIPELGYIFTGQGAQWAKMAAEAMQTFPSFLQTIRHLDAVLHSLPLSPQWTLEEELLAPAESNKINDAEISQPTLTAIQIAIVDLFAQWDIAPAATVGHSSGEMGAAYAAGLISAPEAIIAAFARGYALKHFTSSEGTMLAAGLGADEIGAYIAGLEDDVVIACENSPNSVTLSGTIAAIYKVKTRLDADSIFARELRTGKAYHSPQMNVVGPKMVDVIMEAYATLGDDSLEWRRPLTRMISSVNGAEITAEHITPEYWAKNLCSPVLFDLAVAVFGRTPGLEDVRCMIEIGPHSALAGPFRQICKANGYDHFTYIPSLVRGANSTMELLRSAGELFLQGYPLDLEEVNRIEAGDNMAVPQKLRRPLTLVDLPPYQWNYDKTYWAEPRLSHMQRNLTHMRHDLLGSRIVGISESTFVWRNILRHKDVPWLRDHTLGQAAVFPAAGYLSLAIEGLRQVYDQKNIQVNGITLRDITIKTMLPIPETDDGVEIQTKLEQTPRSDGSNNWFFFSVESLADGSWSSHCEGSVLVNNDDQCARDGSSPVNLDQLTQRIPGKRWYQAFSRVGFDYGPTFQGLGQIFANMKSHKAAADVKIATECGSMVDESRYILHPSTIDACLQLIIISINAGRYKEMSWGVVPIRIEEASLWFPTNEEQSRGHAVAWTDELDGRYFNTHTQLKTHSGKIVLNVKNLRCVAYEAAVPQQMQESISRQPYAESVWKPDISSLRASKTENLLPEFRTESSYLAALVELINHKRPLTSVFLLGVPSESVLEGLLKTVPAATAITMVDTRVDLLEHALQISNSRISTSLLTLGSIDWVQFGALPYDIVIVSECDAMRVEETLQPTLKSLVDEDGWIIFSVEKTKAELVREKLTAFNFPGPGLHMQLQDKTIIVSSKTPYLNGSSHENEELLIVSENPQSSSVQILVNYLKECGCDTQLIHVAEFDRSQTKKIIICDMDGTLLYDLDTKTFDAIKDMLTSDIPIVWLTIGVNEGKSIMGSMPQGFLRSIRSEQSSARVTLLDVDQKESLEHVSTFVLKTIKAVPTKDSGADTEFWLHNGTLHINRLVPNQLLNENFNTGLKPAEEAILPYGKTMHGRVVDGELVFEPCGSDEQSALDVDEIEIQVDYCEFQRIDVQQATETPRLIAGKIIRAGKNVETSVIGQTAVAYAPRKWWTIVRIPQNSCTVTSSSQPSQLLATLPELVKALNALQIARAHSSEHVVLLPAPASVTRAFISLCRSLSLKLTLVANSRQDMDSIRNSYSLPSDSIIMARNFDTLEDLLTSARKVTVVAHAFDHISQEVWRKMPPMARFIVNEGAITEAPDSLPFMKGASFLSTSIRSLLRQDNNLVGQLLKQSLAIMTDNNEINMREPQIYDVSSVKAAAGDQREGIVLAYNYKNSSVKIQPSDEELQLSSNAVYLLVGCLGGLGRSLTTRMMERGARNFAFISRSGVRKAEPSRLVKSLIEAGANVQVFQADAANEEDVARIVAEVNTKIPIRGVVHAAMVLQDAIFAQTMTHEKFTAAIVPKVKGAQALHKALSGHELDFFVMTSSISATLGNPGQSNYSAANSFLDALAWHRTLNGVPAISLVLPMVLDVGVVAETENLEDEITRKGMYGIDEREMLRGFEIAMMQKLPAGGKAGPTLGQAQIILGLEPANLAATIAAADLSDVYWYNDARLRLLRQAAEAAPVASKSEKNSNVNIKELIQAAKENGPDSAVEVIAQHIMKKCATILMLMIDDLEFDSQSIASYGIDSMIGAELRNWLFKEFGLSISFQQLLASTLTFKGLSIQVAETLAVF